MRSLSDLSANSSIGYQKNVNQHHSLVNLMRVGFQTIGKVALTLSAASPHTEGSSRPRASGFFSGSSKQAHTGANN